MQGNLTRRQYLLTGSALAATTAGGIALATNQSAATTANVTGTFSVPDATHVLADTQLSDVTLAVDSQWNFTSNASIHGVELELLVGATESTLDLIARHEQTDLSKQELSGETTLQGSLMSASDFDIQDFTPADGRLERTVIAALRFYALRDGEVVADAEQVTTFDVVVSSEELSVEITLSGSGEVGFQSG